ncbi:MAG: DNA polymerase III subunit delta [Sulfitobacter sp.]
MKLNTRDLNGFVAKPKPGTMGLLLYGRDPMRIALKRQEYLKNLLGPNADEEMRLTRISAAELRREPALLMDALKAIGFFPGTRAALVEDANETVAPIILEAMKAWAPGDAQIAVTAGDLKKTSKLLKAFEVDLNAFAAPIYDNPPDRAEIERLLSQAGLNPDGDAMGALMELAQTLDPGDFRQTLEKITLYKIGDSAPLSSQDVMNCAPASTEAAIDDLLNVVAEARAGDIGPVMAKLQSQGVTPVSLCIGALRHFRTLHRAACSPGAPIYGPNRERLQKQARDWHVEKLETALAVLTDTDLHLRSAGQTAPAMAMVERAFIRLAMTRGARN